MTIDFITDAHLALFTVLGLKMTPESPETLMDELHYFFWRNNIPDVNVPESMVLGGTEIFIGMLLWILPSPEAKLYRRYSYSNGIIRAFSTGREETN